MTVESGTTVRLTCTQESKGTTDITYTWSREEGIPLPDGAQVNNGVCEREGGREGGGGVQLASNEGLSCSSSI